MFKILVFFASLFRGIPSKTIWKKLDLLPGVEEVAGGIFSFLDNWRMRTLGVIQIYLFAPYHSSIFQLSYHWHINFYQYFGI